MNCRICMQGECTDVLSSELSRGKWNDKTNENGASFSCVLCTYANIEQHLSCSCSSETSHNSFKTHIRVNICLENLENHRELRTNTYMCGRTFFSVAVEARLIAFTIWNVRLTLSEQQQHREEKKQLPLQCIQSTFVKWFFHASCSLSYNRTTHTDAYSLFNASFTFSFDNLSSLSSTE